MSENFLLQASDSNVVYLCYTEVHSKTINCLGIGLVRGVDYNQNEIYLLPSVNDEKLKDVNTLVLTNISLPYTIIMNQKIFENFEIPFLGTSDNCLSTRKVVEKFHRPNIRNTNLNNTI